jgi:hypothetical protein
VVRIRSAIVAALAFVPALAAGDRGALTLDVGPALTVLGAYPSQGSGSTTLGTGGGGTIAARYALSNELELAATGFWERPADYFHSSVTMGSSSGPVTGTLAERSQRYGVLAGVRLVRGFVWRLHFGVDVGWAHETFTQRDLLDVSDPGSAHSFGLGLPDLATDAFVLAPVAGMEWQIADHWSVSAMPRLEIILGGPNRVALTVPVMVGYSLYVF